MDKFIVLLEWEPSFNKMTDNQKGILFQAFFDYHNEKEQDFKGDGWVESIWLNIQPNIERMNKNYKSSIENGKKGGRPRKTQSKPNNNLNKPDNNQPLTFKEKEKEEINNNIVEVEGGTSLEGMSPTSSTLQSKKKSGWEKLVEIYPPTKHRDIIEASIYWDTLTQEEKQMIFRHANPYINNTPTQMLKQIGKYLQSDLWRNMKPPTNKEVSQYKNTGFVDYNFIEWYNTFYEIGSWEEANKDFQTLDNETKKIIKTEYERIKRNQKQSVE
jgi:hypothetical protein